MKIMKKLKINTCTKKTKKHSKMMTFFEGAFYTQIIYTVL